MMKNLLLLLCLCGSASADDIQPAAQTSVIPHTSSWAITLMKDYAVRSGVSLGVNWPQSLPLVAGHSYIVSTPDEKVSFSVDALSGDVDLTDNRTSLDLSVEEAKRKFPSWIPEDQLHRFFLQAKDRIYPYPKKLNHLSPLSNMSYGTNGGGYLDANGKVVPGLVYRANDCYARFTQIEISGSRNLNRLDLSISRDKGEVIGFRSIMRTSDMNTSFWINSEQAIEVARYYSTIKTPARLRLQAGFEMNKDKADFLKGHGFSIAGWDKPVPYVEEDLWFSQRLVLEVDFIFSVVKLGTHGQLISAEPRDKWWMGEEKDTAQKLFGLDRPVIYPAPVWLKAGGAPTNSKNEIVVNFNGQQRESFEFFFPPISNRGTATIFADYFPSFLINVTHDGQNITLEGQLPGKGKKARLTLGSTSAIVDGKPVTLSGAPQEIEGRLYLPYELLTLCNGVLTRWEPKKNTLWVDTRYLRRPD